MTLHRFLGSDRAFDGAVFIGSSDPGDDPVDDEPDTVGSPRLMIDVDDFTTLFQWEE